MRSVRDIAWSAGLYEGEGCCTAATERGKYVRIKVTISMTDREPLEKMHRLWGGNLNGPYARNGGNPRAKPISTWSINTLALAEPFFEAISGYLSPRRLTQFECALVEARVWRDRPARPTSPNCGLGPGGGNRRNWHRRRGEPVCAECRKSEKLARAARKAGQQ